MSAIADCIAGVISPEVAVARLLLSGLDAPAMLQALDAAAPSGPVQSMRALVTERRAALEDLAGQVARSMAGHDASGPTPAEGVARIAAFFDQAVRHSPEASVALYSLGDPAILRAATQEIVDWLRAEGLLGPGTDVLDLGCGIGRIAAALAPSCRSVLALDVSAGMVAEATGRLAALPNVRVMQTSGEDLDAVPERGFDLILAIDSFPYIVQTGPDTVSRHIQGAARALRPGGALCILNLSYRGDAGLDQADARAWAAAAGFTLLRQGERPFRLWDGNAFVFRR
ncbi:MAG: class I SAM-dependent methyltransferase [Janthinobacterium lividum]